MNLKNVCCASKGLQRLQRKAICWDEKQWCTVLLGSRQCKLWLQQTFVQKSSSWCKEWKWKQWHRKPDLNFKNHSGRKTTVYNSGHKNIRSVTSYSTTSQKQQLNMSHTSHWTEFRRSSSPVWLFYSGGKVAWVWQVPTFCSTFSQQSKKQHSTFLFFFGCYYNWRIISQGPRSKFLSGGGA